MLMSFMNILFILVKNSITKKNFSSVMPDKMLMSVKIGYCKIRISEDFFFSYFSIIKI